VIGCSKRSNDQTIAQDVQRKLAADPVAKRLNDYGDRQRRQGYIERRGQRFRDATQITREEPGTREMTDETAVVTVPTSNVGAIQRL